MAIAVGSHSTYRSGGSTGTSMPLSVPSGLSADSGGYELVVAGPGGMSSVTISISGGGTGSYTTHHSGRMGGGAEVRGCYFVASREPAASPAEATVSWSSPYPNVVRVGFRLALSGVDQADPINAISAAPDEGTTSVSASPVATAEAITTDEDNCLAIAWADFSIGELGETVSVSGGWTLIDAEDAFDEGPLIAMAYKVVPSAGTTGDCTFTRAGTNASSTRAWAAGQIAFKPVEGGPPPFVSRPRGGMIF